MANRLTLTQLHASSPNTAVVAVGRAIGLDKGVACQVATHCLPEDAGTFPVNYPYPVKAGLKSSVQELIEFGQRIINSMTV